MSRLHSYLLCPKWVNKKLTSEHNIIIRQGYSLPVYFNKRLRTGKCRWSFSKILEKMKKIYSGLPEG